MCFARANVVRQGGFTKDGRSGGTVPYGTTKLSFRWFPLVKESRESGCNLITGNR